MEEEPVEEGGSVSEILQEIVSLWQEYIASPESDDIETAEATKGLVIAQKLLAEEQKQSEAAMGTTPAHKGITKAISGIKNRVYGE